ncbi:MAG: helix-turn-helix transcriptional regulator [Nitrospinae bacterium]|nr:helix-turn-helix transcriptional regulator [Nitrospinota bacterium]
MTQAKTLHKKWLKDAKYKKEYEKLAPEFELARAIIEARAKAGMTQAQLARKMKTTQSVIARLEGGRVHPSTKTLERLAKATGSRLKIDFEFKTA